MKTREEYISQIREIVKQNPTSYFTVITSKKNKELLNFINQNTPLLQNPIYHLSTKIFWILNGIKEFPICPTCGKPIGINKIFI